MKILKNQKGFSLVEGLLIIIALSIVGFTGFYVYNANKKEPNISDSSIYHKEKQNDLSKQTEEDTAQNLDIKEYGVKVPLSNDLLDSKYRYEDGYVYVSSDTLEKAAKACSDDNFDSSIESFISLSKVSGQYEKESAEGGLLKQFDSFYITGGHPNGTQCNGKDEVATQAYVNKLEELNSSFTKAFENATLIQ